MKREILEAIIKAAIASGIEQGAVLSAAGIYRTQLDYPESADHGDFSSNIAMANAKKLGLNPKALADMIVSEFKKVQPDFIADVSVAGPGFINFKVKDSAFAASIVDISKSITQGKGNEYGKGNIDAGKNIIVEHTDPNAFKAFHIGHLMANAIGESLSRLVEFSGANTTRICYPADIGLHIAKAIWAMKKHTSEIPADSAMITDKTAFLGKMYVEGTAAYDASESSDKKVKDEIDALNKVIYEKSDSTTNAFYETGKAWSMEHFEILFKRLGTRFDDYIYESAMAPIGLTLVKDALEKGVFENSEGAVVFKGEQYGLYTRVFINAHGLPTYEAKDIGLNTTKFKKYPKTDQSIIVTANEQNDYFRVLLKALSFIDANAAIKTKHIGHGMLRFASGKMSSRTGKVITAEALISDIRELVKTKIAGRNFSDKEADELSDIIAIGAIKYTILRQSIGGDVIFDSVSSISFEGDSGPYLQYAAVRAGAILEKAKQEGIEGTNEKAQGASKSVKAQGADISALPEKVSLVEKLITRFPDVVERARAEYAPQYVANYLVNLAGAFNSFYASQQVVDVKNPLSPYYVALTKAFRTTMINGLGLLGIKVPERM